MSAKTDCLYLPENSLKIDCVQQEIVDSVNKGNKAGRSRLPFCKESIKRVFLWQIYKYTIYIYINNNLFVFILYLVTSHRSRKSCTSSGIMYIHSLQERVSRTTTSSFQFYVLCIVTSQEVFCISGKNFQMLEIPAQVQGQWRQNRIWSSRMTINCFFIRSRTKYNRRIVTKFIHSKRASTDNQLFSCWKKRRHRNLLNTTCQYKIRFRFRTKKNCCHLRLSTWN